MATLECDCPAKINLHLSIHGRREDGFHALTSLMVPLKFGDALRVERLDDSQQDTLHCDAPEIPLDKRNLILQAANRFRFETNSEVYFSFELTKRIPVGAGLGGGSSNAAVALRMMNKLCGEPLKKERLIYVAAQLGSDCPFFLESGAMIVSGRGEILKPLDGGIARSLSGLPVILFKPEFAISTKTAYDDLIQDAPASYTNERKSEDLLSAFKAGGELLQVLHNSFEKTASRKYRALEAVLFQLREARIPCLMSGSGSCCFAVPANSQAAHTAETIAKNAFGDHSFIVKTCVA